VTIDKLRREFDREKPVCELCGLPVGADYLLKDGDHTYHRVCSNATATSVYRQLQDKVAALEAELERQKQTTVWTLDRAEQAEAALAALMEEGYREMAEDSLAFAEATLPATAETLPEW